MAIVFGFIVHVACRHQQLTLKMCLNEFWVGGGVEGKKDVTINIWNETKTHMTYKEKPSKYEMTPIFKIAVASDKNWKWLWQLTGEESFPKHVMYCLQYVEVLKEESQEASQFCIAAIYKCIHMHWVRTKSAWFGCCCCCFLFVCSCLRFWIWVTQQIYGSKHTIILFKIGIQWHA